MLVTHGFPYAINNETMAKLNYYSRCEYFQPRYCDKNVVPYHATILLV